LLEDPDRHRGGDPIDIGDAEVTVAQDTIMFRVQHSVDGLVATSVFIGDDPGELPVEYFDGEISTKYGCLVLRDVPDENRVTLPAGPTVWWPSASRGVGVEPSRAGGHGRTQSAVGQP
jgi:hypothetical protein